MARVQRFFPRPMPRVDNRRGWQDHLYQRARWEQCDQGSIPRPIRFPTTLERWIDKGAIARMIDALAAGAAFLNAVTINMSDLKAESTAIGPR